MRFNLCFAGGFSREASPMIATTARTTAITTSSPDLRAARSCRSILLPFTDVLFVEPRSRTVNPSSSRQQNLACSLETLGSSMRTSAPLPLPTRILVRGDEKLTTWVPSGA
jgi:hypothetical protein